MRAKIGALAAAIAAAVGTAGAAKWARSRREQDEFDLEATEAETGPPPADAGPPDQETTRPTFEGPAADDLTAIKGLGRVKAAKLVEAGVTSYGQVAAWSDEDIAEIGLKVNTSPGQIKREDWVGQAKALAEG